MTWFEDPKLILSIAGGILPINFWYLFRTILVIINSTTALLLALRNKKQTLARANGRGMNIFMLTISIILFLVNIFGSLNILIVNQIIPIQADMAPVIGVVPPLLEFLVLISLLGINFMFFFIPENTFGLPLPKQIEPMNNENLISHDSSEKALEVVEKLKEKETFEEEPISSKAEPQLRDKEKKILYQLLYGMETEQWYRQKNFNVETCSERLGCEKHVLGRIFRIAIKKRFTDFVNVYRISFVIEEIRADKLASFTLEGLSEQAGFNSRVTFYNAFLKQKGTSPSKFIAEFLKTSI